MRKVVLSLWAIQVAATLAVAGGFFAWVGIAAVLAVIYGGAVALVVSALLAWRMNRASRPGSGAAGLYLGALERMAFVAVAFVLALAVLKLQPLALIAGFIGAEMAYYIAAAVLRRQI